jgi:hypothetical protein
MPYNTPLPAENTDPWYAPLVSGFIGGLRDFVNALEATVGGKASTAALTAGLASKADLVGGVVPTSQLPPLAINDTFPVDSQAAMLALTAQRGDVAIRSDLNQSFILAAEPASTLGNWKALLAPGTVVSVAGKSGVVSLVVADVEGLTAALAGKATTGDFDNVFTVAQDAQSDATLALTSVGDKVDVADVAGVNQVGWGRMVYIENGAPDPVGLPDPTLIIELPED